MLRILQILVRVVVVAASAACIAGCGQKGSLVLPTEPAAAQRATLPQTLRPGAAIPPATGASAATRTP